MSRDLLIAADVGQDMMEEINIIKNGANYGWARFEGTAFYKDTSLKGGGKVIDYSGKIYRIVEA